MNITASANIRAVCFLLVFLLASRAAAQVSATDTTTTKPALISLVDTTRTPIVPIPFVGSIERNPTYLITDSSKNFIDYHYAGDFLSMVPGMFVRDLGSPGQLNGFTIDGLDGRNIAYMSDGILLNEPLTGTYSPYLYPTENIERVEIITGTRAFLYGLNSTGMAVNFVSRNRKAIHPYTRIRYEEAPFGQGFFDGMFSQDILRGLNLTTGVQHVTYDGRFPNSNYDNWGGRVKVRYNLNNKLDLFGSWIYNQTNLGLNGGVNTDLTPEAFLYDRLQATMVNTDAYEKLTRNDFQLGAAATPFSDTTAITTLTLYHSTNFREYRDEENRDNSNGIFVHEDDRTQSYGAKLVQHFVAGTSPVDFGLDAQARGIVAGDSLLQHFETSVSYTGTGDFELIRNIYFSPSVKFQDYLEHAFISYGGEVSFTPVEWANLFGGYSNSYNSPSVFDHFSTKEDYSLSTVYFVNEHLLEIGLKLNDERIFRGTIKYFHRSIQNTHTEAFATTLDYPVGQSRFQELLTNGFSLDGKIHLGGLFLEGNGEYIISKADNNEINDIPKWSGTAGLYFWDKLFEDHLDLKIGVRGRGSSFYHTTVVDQRAQVFTSTTGLDIPTTGVLDFVLMAHIGSAYIHLIMENLLDRQYVTTTFYPMNERTLRFGLSWEFLD